MKQEKVQENGPAGENRETPMGECVFCRIVRGETEAHLIHADAHTLSFLDHNPLFPGHVLVIPRMHHATLPDLPPELLAPLFGHARRIARGLKWALGLDGTFVAINNGVGQSVPHLHVHVIPRRMGDGMRDLYLPRKDFADADERANVVRTLSEYMASFPD